MPGATRHNDLTDRMNLTGGIDVKISPEDKKIRINKNVPVRIVQDLANEIIIAAVRDYRMDPYEYGKELKDFLYGEWFSELSNLDGPKLFQVLQKEVMEKEERRQRNQKRQNIAIVVQAGRIIKVCGTACNVNVDIIDCTDSSEAEMENQDKLENLDVLFPFSYPIPSDGKAGTKEETAGSSSTSIPLR